jgi:hypothetical protein
MTGHVHLFDAREGGRFRISLAYLNPEDSLGGKTSEDTDTFQGTFVELVLFVKVVEVIEFESQRPELAGKMTLTVTLADADAETEGTMLCEDTLDGVRPEDNEMGCKQSLEKLASLLASRNQES